MQQGRIILRILLWIASSVIHNYEKNTDIKKPIIIKEEERFS